MITRTFLSFFILVLCSLTATSQEAVSLLSDMDQIMFGAKDKQGNVEIILVNKSGTEKVREADFFQKGNNKKLYRYTKPESQAGIATLSLPGDVMWLYMPAFGKPKRISLLAKSQAFTGTDFSYEDMATTSYLEKYKPQIKETNALGIVLELMPKIEKSPYSKLIVTLESTHHYPILIEYFDRGGQKFKEASYKYQRNGKYWNASEVIMTNIKKNHITKIKLTNVKFDQGLTDDLFEVEKLRIEN